MKKVMLALAVAQLVGCAHLGIKMPTHKNTDEEDMALLSDSFDYLDIIAPHLGHGVQGLVKLIK